MNTGSAALLDGVQAPDGSGVSAANEAGVLVDATTITDGTWAIQVEPTAATTVVFRIEDSCPSAAFAVASGTLTQVALDLLSLANSGTSGCGGQAPPPLPPPTSFSATLSGDAVVPPITTIATGGFNAMVTDGALDYTLTSDALEITQAHIHLGEPDVNGTVVAFLFGPADPAVDGVLTSGTITVADLLDVLAGDFEAFVASLSNGQTYADVHAAANPAGQVRGQIEPVPPGPAQFFGSVNTGSAALLDGVQAPDGSGVSAANEAGVLVDATTITDGTWVIQVEPTVATTVVFRIGDSCPSDAFAVVSGTLSEVALDLVSLANSGPNGCGGQEPPPVVPPQGFFGSESTGSGALLDGELAAAGSVVRADNESGELVGEATIANLPLSLGGLTWEILVFSADAASVTFTIGDSCPSDSFDVLAGAFTEVALDLVSPANSGPKGCPAPSGGGGPSGGLAGLELVIAGSPADLSEVHSVVAFCPAGKKAIGGGYEVLLDGGIALNVSEVALQRSAPFDIELTGWEVVAVRTFPETKPNDPPPPLWQLQVFAVCAIAAS